MSRVGRKPLALPSGVTATIDDRLVIVKGPKAELRLTLPVGIDVTQTTEGQETVLTVIPLSAEDLSIKALWGTMRALLANMVEGVSKGFQRQLEVNGVGYRVAVQGRNLALELGFSHPITFPLPEGITATVEKNVITLSGSDKFVLGEVAAHLRRLRKPEPYKGKGIKYMDEVIRRKAGKAAKTA